MTAKETEKITEKVASNKTSANKIRKNFSHYVADVEDKKNKKGKYIISTLGYQSTEEKIKAMTMAGINLALIRGSFQSELIENEEKMDSLKVDNMARSRTMDIQQKIEIARQTKDKLEKYKAKLDAEQKKVLAERQEYLERMTKEYEGLLAQKGKKDAEEPNLAEKTPT